MIKLLYRFTVPQKLVESEHMDILQSSNYARGQSATNFWAHERGNNRKTGRIT